MCPLASGRLKALRGGPRAGGQALALAADRVTARIKRGEVVSCEAGTEQDADAWALGSLDGWLKTVIDPYAKAVRTGGDAWLTDALVSAIHHALFGTRNS